ncbi:uncharacterized protein LOC119515355 isoform X1 [Choloepus didactylus]|uniref:uncharacterized protein LOC119515355 isoform X1 n=1 Tax=Choloepus didactylus TaxID=27675 RepID=UPI00189DADB4|nr:uncharacterized protein LOC119515355 isoform X1 [Choloepus didactylus]
MITSASKRLLRSCEQELMRWPEIQETLSRHRNSPDLRMESLSRTVNLRAATEKCELKLGQRRWRKTEPQQHTEDNDFKCLKRLRVAELPSSYHTTAQKLPMAPYSLFKNFFIVITGWSAVYALTASPATSTCSAQPPTSLLPQLGYPPTPTPTQRSTCRIQTPPSEQHVPEPQRADSSEPVTWHHRDFSVIH